MHFFSLHWEMKGHWSRVNIFPRLYEMPVSADCSISLKNEKDMHPLVLYWIDIYILFNAKKYMSVSSHPTYPKIFCRPLAFYLVYVVGVIFTHFKTTYFVNFVY